MSKRHTPTGAVYTGVDTGHYFDDYEVEELEAKFTAAPASCPAASVLVPHCNCQSGVGLEMSPTTLRPGTEDVCNSCGYTAFFKRTQAAFAAKPKRVRAEPGDITGRTFGRLTVVADGLARSATCRCECGAEVQIFRPNLLSGNTTSCGKHRGKRAAPANQPA